jgi:hypothetical protein
MKELLADQQELIVRQELLAVQYKLRENTNLKVVCIKGRSGGGIYGMYRFQEMTVEVHDQISNGHYDPVSPTGLSIACKISFVTICYSFKNYVLTLQA